MAILHGNWLIIPPSGGMFFWGETWRRIKPIKSSKTDSVLSHPLTMNQEELISFLDDHHLSIQKFLAVKPSTRWQEKTVSLPTHIVDTGEPAYPAYSRTFLSATDSSLILHPWKVHGLYLEPLEAIQFLQALPLNFFKAADAYIGSDLRYWSHLARWSLDLVARGKFLPTLQHTSDQILAHWSPLLDSAVDQVRLDKFLQVMPAACLSYLQDNQEDSQPTNIPDSEELLLSFLSITVDTLVRNWASLNSPSITTTPIKQWLEALVHKSNHVVSTKEQLIKLESALQSWITPVQDYLIAPFTTAQILQSNLFRTCFSLKPPSLGESDWTLEYFLQAADNPEILIDAIAIWNNPLETLVYQQRTILRPQETFLKGLGLAAKLYPIIASSLNNARPQFCKITPIQVYEFIKAAAWRLQDSGLGVILPSSLMPENADTKRLGLKISATTNSEATNLGLQSLLKFNWELAIGNHRISKQEFEQMMALKTPFVQVNGEWVMLQPSDVKAAQTLLATPKTQMALSLEDALRLSTGDSKTIEKLPVVSFETSGVLEELITNLTDNQKINAIAIPASFKGELRPYQERGVAWLSFLERWGLGACLADDMGLGKSIQTIGFLLHLQESGKLEKPTLLICPTSVLGNWEREIKKFSTTLKTVVHHGDKRAKGKEFVKTLKAKDLIITSYALAFRDAITLKSIAWRCIILDEAQNIKNPEAKQSKMVRELNAEFRIALTGTPVENRLQELWSILDFLNPGYLGNRQFFQRRFAMPIEKYGDKNSLETLRSLVQPFILRRLKTDKSIIQDLPEKQEMTVFSGLSSEQAELYQKLVDESLPNIDEAEGIQRHGMVLTLLLRLKQICNHPAQYLKEKNLGSSQRSGKLQRLEEMLAEALEEGDRVLIFTQFAECGKLLQPYLQEKLGWETLFLYGSTTKQKREEMVDRFQNDPEGPRILILSLKAGGTGLNLTRANHVFHFDRWWNPAVENQATDRVFRIGQTRNVQVHKFVCIGTLEEKINALIESKKQLADQTVDAGEQWLTEMNTDQLRNLLLLDRSAIIEETD